MANKRRTGLDYFPKDVGFSEDLKIRKLVHSCDNIGELLVDDIYCHIYKNFYFVEYDNDFKFILAEKRKIAISVVEKVVSRALELDIFDKELFDNYNILTSNGIQKRVYNVLHKHRFKVEIDISYIKNESLLSYITDIKNSKNEKEGDQENAEIDVIIKNKSLMRNNNELMRNNSKKSASLDTKRIEKNLSHTHCVRVRDCAKKELPVALKKSIVKTMETMRDSVFVEVLNSESPPSNSKPPSKPSPIKTSSRNIACAVEKRADTGFSDYFEWFEVECAKLYSQDFYTWFLKYRRCPFPDSAERSFEEWQKLSVEERALCLSAVENYILYRQGPYHNPRNYIAEKIFLVPKYHTPPVKAEHKKRHHS